MSSIDFDQPGKAVKSPTRFAHVVLRTNQLGVMTKFYEKFLGAHVVSGNDMLKFLAYDEEHHRIAIVQTPQCQDKIINSCGLEV